MGAQSNLYMARSKSSHRWLKEHFADPYVKRAQREGYRSRAAYKLLELQEKDRLFKQGIIVVDLGAAPGGWSQVAAQLIAPTGHLYALDILPMEELAGVEFLQGDFREAPILQTLLERMQGAHADIVMSDMAPNMSGMSGVDQPRMMYLAELALDLCQQILRPEGTFLLKLFQGEGFDAFLRTLRQNFKQITVRKPQASKSRSAEVYLVAKGFRGQMVINSI